MVKVSVDDLKYKCKFGLNNNEYQDGYRIVYFYPDDNYSVGTFSGEIEWFMMNFAERDPIEDDDDIPPFISTDDLLDRYLTKFQDISAVAIYKTDGTCIAKKEQTNKKTI